MFLFFGAVEKDAHGTDPVAGADAGPKTGVGFGEFFIDQALSEGPQAEPAVFFGNGQAEEAQIPHLLNDLFRNGVFFFHLPADGFKILLHKPDDGLPHHRQVLRYFKIHHKFLS